MVLTGTGNALWEFDKIILNSGSWICKALGDQS